MVIFIPTQCRELYEETKPDQPITLTSLLLKTLEKIIDKYSRNSVLASLYTSIKVLINPENSESWKLR